MTVDPYEVLGVPRDATEADIKAAYRSKAKNVHPDAGGSEQEFHAVATSYAVLSNPEKRDRFDRTGKMDEPLDRDRHDALSLLRQMTDGFLAEAEGKSTITVDPVRNMGLVLDKRLAEIKDDVVKLTAKATKYEKIAAKFGKAEGDNILRRMVESNVEDLRSNLRAAERAIVVTELAKALLAGHSFEVDAQESNVFQSVHYDPWRRPDSEAWFRTVYDA